MLGQKIYIYFAKSRKKKKWPVLNMAACVSGFIKFGWLVMVCIEKVFGRAILRNFYCLNTFEILWLVPKIVKQEIATFQKFLIWTPNFRDFYFTRPSLKLGLFFRGIFSERWFSGVWCAEISEVLNQYFCQEVMLTIFVWKR